MELPAKTWHSLSSWHPCPPVGLQIPALPLGMVMFWFPKEWWWPGRSQVHTPRAGGWAGLLSAYPIPVVLFFLTNWTPVLFGVATCPLNTALSLQPTVAVWSSTDQWHPSSFCVGLPGNGFLSGSGSVGVLLSLSSSFFFLPRMQMQGLEP